MRVHLFAVPFREAMLLSITSGDWCLARVHVLRFYLDERDKKMWGVPQTLERAACKVEKVISFDLVTLADRLTRQKCVCVCVCVYASWAHSFREATRNSHHCNIHTWILENLGSN